jgi:hypothetical protein
LSNKETLKKNHNDDIKSVYDRVSSVFLKELDAELNSLLKLISIFKNESYGPIGHRGYSKAVNKMYLITQRLKSIANNTMNKNILIEKMEMIEDDINVKLMVSNLVDDIENKTNRDLKLELFNDHEYRIKFNLENLIDVLEVVLMQIIKITTNDHPIRVNLFIDHENNFVFAFHGVIPKDLQDENLDIDIELKKKRDELIKQGGDIDFKTDEGNAIALVSIPEYKVIK